MDVKNQREIHDVRLVYEETHLITELNGFQKFHRIPESSSATNIQFLHDITATDLDTNLQTTFAALKKAFGFKRNEVAVTGPIDGGALIETPFFSYELNILFCKHDVSQVILRSAISNIRTPEKIFDAPFQQAFGKKFSILEVSALSPLDIEPIIDHIEELELNTLSIEYDKDATWCEVHVSDVDAYVKIQENRIRVIRLVESTPRQLVETFLTIQQQFLASLDCDTNPFMADSQ